MEAYDSQDEHRAEQAQSAVTKTRQRRLVPNHRSRLLDWASNHDLIATVTPLDPPGDATVGARLTPDVASPVQREGVASKRQLGISAACRSKRKPEPPISLSRSSDGRGDAMRDWSTRAGVRLRADLASTSI
jgi:hypothetical protein